ncbi:DNA polymerase III subunit delta [Thalassotalea sp. PLHSN55]|uniref:DNA polymerase III subunit delta n=1 Tax=Thalassotalea sp. PLHSN55 TaxID=3435888 RepID=UPI003F831E7B
MKIYHNQLNATLNQGFKPVWLVFGDEPWQKNNALSVIKQHAQQQGFSETIRFSADEKFDWLQVVDEYQAMSLFASQRIIEVELTNVKVNEAASKVLLELAQQFHQDVQLIIHGGKLDANQQKKKWFKSFSQAGCFLPLYDIEGKQLQQWLTTQARQLSVNLSPELVPLLIDLFEGNLPALEQELQKLSLIFGHQAIGIEDAEQIIIKQAKFNPFQLVDALLSGDLKRCVTMLDQLQQEGCAAGQLVWVLHKEINQLHHMIESLNQGESLNNLYKQYRIWDKRKPLYQHALNNISLANIEHGQARLAQVDLISKTSSDFDVFLLLSDVCISLYHGKTTAQFSLDYEYA